jgi:predicted phage terminase large subunit-like protein
MVRAFGVTRAAAATLDTSSKDDKETRMSHHQGRLEAGRLLLPTEAPWLADFERELLSFPAGRYDDQVDALLLFLDWYSHMIRLGSPLSTL